MENASKKYMAFISYSHANNSEEGRKWADWLHHSLETYEIPEELIGKQNLHGGEIPRQIFPVFQDEKELSASSNLNASLTEALDNAEFLIYLSSPRSAGSIYVRNEIRHFKQTGKSAKMIALILSGEPEYGDATTDQQCFPDELRYEVDENGQIDKNRPHEVLAADVRIAHSTLEGFTSSEAYRRYLHDTEKSMSHQEIKVAVEAYKKRLDLALLKIIACILDVPLRELTKRDQAYQLEKAKRKNRNIKRITAVIGTLAILAIIAGIMAWKQKNKAQRSLARSLYTSGINKLTESEYGDGAAYIAEATRQGDPGAEMFANSMLAMQPDLSLMPSVVAANTRFSYDGKWIAAFASAGAGRSVLQIWDAKARRLYKQVDGVKTLQAHQPFFDTLGRVYARGWKNDLYRYDIVHHQLDLLYNNLDSSFLALKALSANGRYLAYNKENKTVLYDTNNGKTFIIYESDGLTPVDIYFNGSSSRVVCIAAIKDLDDIRLYDLSGPAPLLLLNEKLRSGVKKPALDIEGNQVVFNNLDGLFYYNLQNKNAWKRPQRSYNYSFVAFTKKGQLVAGNEYDVDVLSPADGRVLSSQKLPQNLFFSDPFLKQIVNANTFTTVQHAADYTQQIIDENGQAFIENIKATPMQLNRYYADSALSQVLVGENEQQLYISNKNSPLVEKLDLATGKRNPWLRLTEPSNFMELLRKSKVLIIKGLSGKTYLYNAQTGKQIGAPIESQVKSYLFNKDQTEVLLRTGPSGFGIWSLLTGEKRIQYDHKGPLLKFTSNPDFKSILTVSDTSWKVYEIPTGKIIREGKERISSGAFNTTGDYLVIVSSSGKATVYETKGYTKLVSISTIEFPFMAFNNKGDVLAISEDDSHVRLWDLNEKKSFGQTIRVSKYSKFFTFSKDDSKIFVQDDADHLNYALKVVDAKTAAVLTMPLINRRFSALEILPSEQQCLTVEPLIKGYSINIWEMPGIIHIPAKSLAADLEKFYGKKYDETTGAIMNYQDSAAYHTWYFKDPLTRTVTPASKRSIVADIQGNYPVKSTDNLYLLGASYSYHPLARAAMADYFSLRPETAYLAERIVAATRGQVEKIQNKDLKNRVVAILNKVAARLQ